MTGLVLYGFPLSANTHRVRLVLSMLGLEYEERTVNLAAGEQHQPAYGAVNPRKVVPALEDASETLVESYSIMIYLAGRYAAGDKAALWSSDPLEQARISSWMFYDANEMRNGLGLVRNERSFGQPSAGAQALARGEASLDLLERRLGEAEWLECGRPTLADLAVHPFASVVEEAGLTLDGRPNTTGWLERVAALPGFVPMPRVADLRR